MAKALFGTDGTPGNLGRTPLGRPRTGRFDSLLATLRVHASTSEQAGQCARYIAKNGSRMRN